MHKGLLGSSSPRPRPVVSGPTLQAASRAGWPPLQCLSSLTDTFRHPPPQVHWQRTATHPPSRGPWTFTLVGEHVGAGKAGAPYTLPSQVGLWA